MTDKEFKRLNRSQLIEIIYQFQLKQDELIAENERLSKELADKRLRVTQAGNIAEAALAVNNVMQDAQNAAQQYLDEIRAKYSEVDAECEQLRKKAREEAAAIVAQARKEAAAMQTMPKKSVSITAQSQMKPASIGAQPQKQVSAQLPKKDVKAEAPAKKQQKVTSAATSRKSDNDILLEQILSEFGSSSKL